MEEKNTFSELTRKKTRKKLVQEEKKACSALVPIVYDTEGKELGTADRLRREREENQKYKSYQNTGLERRKGAPMSKYFSWQSKE